MATLSSDELKSRISSLKRAPVPKVPVGANKPCFVEAEPGGFVFPKLKHTGKRESLIESSEQNGNTNNELKSAFANRRALFEQNDMKPPTKPKPKPGLQKRFSEGEKENEERPATKDSNENIVSASAKPKMKSLPTLQSIGSPPRKPPRSVSLETVLAKYRNESVIIAPRAKSVTSETDVDGTETDPGGEVYDDLDTGDAVDDDITADNTIGPVPEEEPIQDEMYDDVDELADQVKAELAQDENYDPESSEPVSDEFYDDLDTFKATLPSPQPMGNNLQADDTQEYGDELYQPVDTLGVGDVGGEEEYELLPNEPPPLLPGQRDQPSPPQCQSGPDQEENKRKEKKNREKEKKERELQKKKEKDDLKRRKEEEKREREEKKRKEDEKKRREKVDRELRKIHKLKGNEPNVDVGRANEDFNGVGKQELPCSKGASLCVISKDGCPPGKWLVKDTEGHIGYVPSSAIDLEAANNDAPSEALDDDLYECVDTYQDQAQSYPPPPPSPRPPQRDLIEEEDEFYEETMEDEEIYDDIG